MMIIIKVIKNLNQVHLIILLKWKMF